MSLSMMDPLSERIPEGMVKVRWVLKNRRSIETVEIDDVDRIKASQFVVPGDRVYDVTSVVRGADALVVRCWPAAA